MDRFLEGLGVAHEAGEFSLNQGRATEFLTQAWGGQRPRSVYPLHLLACAVSSGATRFSFSRRPPPLVFLKNMLFQDRWGFFAEHDGEPPEVEELESLAESLWKECRPGVRYLALACQLAQSLYKSRVSVEACRGTTFDRMVVKNGVWTFSPGLKLGSPFKGLRFRAEFSQRSVGALGGAGSSFDPGEESRALKYCGRWAPLELAERSKVEPPKGFVAAYWQESRASAILTELEARPSPYDFSLLIDVGYNMVEEGWVFLRHGVVLAEAVSYGRRATAIEGVRFVVCSSRFQLDASHRALVHDGYFDSVVGRCLEMLGALLSELDLEVPENRDELRGLILERELAAKYPPLYELPVFETAAGLFLGATQARQLAMERPEAFSPRLLEELRWVWDWDLPDYLFGQGFPRVTLVKGAGRYLLCRTEAEVHGILDCERREFQNFGSSGTLVPGTSTWFRCLSSWIEVGDLNRHETSHVELDEEFQQPVLSATPDFGLILDQGSLHKLDLHLPKLLGESALEGDFQQMEFWCDSVVLLKGEDEWGLYETDGDTWLLREPNSGDGYSRRVHLEEGGDLAVEEFPDTGAEGNPSVRVFRFHEGMLGIQQTSWQEWTRSRESARVGLSSKGRVLGAALGVLYAREKGCLWSLSADSAPRLLARNDGLRQLHLHSDSMIWFTEKGSSVFCRASERLTFYEGTFMLQNCLVRPDQSDSTALELLDPMTGEVTTRGLRGMDFGRPPHLAGWIQAEEIVLCEPATGRVLNRCSFQSGRYWLNEKWSLRYSGKWTVKAVGERDWERVELPRPEEHKGVSLLGDFVLFETDREILVYRVSGGKYLTLLGGLLTLSDPACSIAVFDEETLRLVDLREQQVLDFPENEHWDFSVGSARFWEGQWFAHPWAGVVRKGTEGWAVVNLAWRSFWADKGQGELTYDWNLGTVSFSDLYTGVELAKLHADGPDWFFYTPLGLYDCSDAGEELLRSDVDREAIKKYRRKGLMGQLLSSVQP